ncbi:MAG TPA: hypothetical protein VFM55_26850 [Micromonosporaceae bacterium]|nr:hypothetical protein [Micromonosporaceae bacterium]
MTVVEARVHRSSARNARLGFFVTLTVVTVLAAVVAAASIHPILALLLGLLIAAPTAAVVWTLVRVWPVIRLLWWWAPETLLTAGLLAGWVQLANHTPTLVTLIVVALLVGVPAAVPPVRRSITAWAWCLVVRHRLRVCFDEFIIANQSGTLPLILLARPTPVGERVWVYLRPGLCLADLATRLDRIAVACHARTAHVEAASDRNAALLRFDIKRRNALTATVASPLPGLVDPSPAPQQPGPVPAAVPTALDLPDVPAEPATKPATPTNGRKPATTPAASTSTDELADWI